MLLKFFELSGIVEGGAGELPGTCYQLLPLIGFCHQFQALFPQQVIVTLCPRITSYNVCYTKLLRLRNMSKADNTVKKANMLNESIRLLLPVPVRIMVRRDNTGVRIPTMTNGETGLRS